jgi:hypothetical protein
LGKVVTETFRSIKRIGNPKAVSASNRLYGSIQGD